MRAARGGNNGTRALDRREHELLDRIDAERRRLIEQARELRRPLRNADRVGDGLREIRRVGGLPLLVLPGAVMLWRARPVIRLGLRAWATWKLLQRMTGTVRSVVTPGRHRGGRPYGSTAFRTRGPLGRRSLQRRLWLLGSLAGVMLARKWMTRKPVHS